MKTGSQIVRYGFSILFFLKKTNCMNRSMGSLYSDTNDELDPAFR
jgi:hypothetical protein